MWFRGSHDAGFLAKVPLHVVAIGECLLQRFLSTNPLEQALVRVERLFVAIEQILYFFLEKKIRE